MTDANFSEEHKDPIDSLLAEMYGQDVDKPRVLDREGAIEAAKDLFRLEEEIAEWMAAQPDRIEVDPNVSFFRARGSETLYTSGKKLLQGIGKGDVAFSVWPELIQTSNVLSRFSLHVYLHTDDLTKSYAEKASGKEYNELSTNYRFDENGNFQKRVFLPKRSLRPEQITYSIKGYRDGGQSSEINAVWEDREMSAGDFELAGAALQALLRIIKPPDKNTIDH